jgi:hypothetical protein
VEKGGKMREETVKKIAESMVKEMAEVMTEKVAKKITEEMGIVEKEEVAKTMAEVMVGLMMEDIGGGITRNTAEGIAEEMAGGATEEIAKERAEEVLEALEEHIVEWVAVKMTQTIKEVQAGVIMGEPIGKGEIHVVFLPSGDVACLKALLAADKVAGQGVLLSAEQKEEVKSSLEVIEKADREAEKTEEQGADLTLEEDDLVRAEDKAIDLASLIVNSMPEELKEDIGEKIRILVEKEMGIKRRKSVIKLMADEIGEKVADLMADTMAEYGMKDISELKKKSEEAYYFALEGADRIFEDALEGIAMTYTNIMDSRKIGVSLGRE